MSLSLVMFLFFGDDARTRGASTSISGVSPVSLHPGQHTYRTGTRYRTRCGYDQRHPCFENLQQGVMLRINYRTVLSDVSTTWRTRSNWRQIIDLKMTGSWRLPVPVRTGTYELSTVWWWWCCVMMMMMCNDVLFTLRVDTNTIDAYVYTYDSDHQTK